MPLLAAHQRSPAARGQRPRQRLDCPVWQGLEAGHLARLAQQLDALGLEASLYPAGEQAGIPLLLLGTNRFSPSWCRRSKPRSGTSISVIWPPCLPWSEPGLLVMDMDSTAIRIECIDEIARLAGVGEQVAAVTAAAMQGKLEFADSLRARVALLEGAPVTILDEVAADMPWMPGLPLMVDTLKSRLAGRWRSPPVASPALPASCSVLWV